MEDASVIRDLLASKGAEPSAGTEASPQKIDRVLSQHGKRFSRGSYAAHCFDRYKQQLQDMYKDNLFIGITIFTYAVILLFVYLLYKSYKNISVTDSARKLMKNILKTRKVIRYYVIYNLAMVFVSMVFGFVYSSGHDPELAAQIEHFNTQQYAIMIATFIIATLIFGVVIWLFYKLLYGILLKRLNKNYNELKKIEV